MGTRLELQSKLEELLGSRKVYFQPPPNVLLEYPCIVYELSRIKPRFADDAPYTLTNCYDVTYIDNRPDSNIPVKIASIPICYHERRFSSDNITHDIFTLYF